ncbi:MAG: amidohydrolase [Spirochaetales bacterium]|nr:amidohydrolase [Spirochaetales bacterium]
MNPSTLATLTERATLHRRALHCMPELGLDLPRSLDYVRTALAAAGLEPRDCGPGLSCDVGDAGPLVAIRADLDALPVAEETGLSFASDTPGRMHACGHDAHGGALLAAAEQLAKTPPSGYRVRLIFQPGEEGAFGAVKMIDAGCLDGVSAIVGGHVGDLSEELAPGQAGFLPGPMMAASDRFSGTFVGSGGHGSAPHQTLDPIAALAQFIQAVYAFRSRRPDQRKPFVLSVCQVSAGSAFNVIPGSAEFKGTARTLEPAERDLARAGLEAACSGAALACGLEGRFEWIDGYPPLANHPEATRLSMKAAEDALGPGRVVELTVPSMGGEDFSYYLMKVPGCFWFLNTQAPESGITHPNHHPRFDVDERWLGSLAAVNLAAAEALALKFGRT